MTDLHGRLNTEVRQNRGLQNLSTNMQAVIAGVQGRLPDGADLDWDEVARLAAVHGVAPLLSQAWSNFSDVIPSKCSAKLHRAREQSRLNGAFGLCQRDEVLQLLGDAKVPCLVLKGAALASAWYGDISLRPFIDIDLWVESNDINRARKVLLQHGYEERKAPMVLHHELPLQHPSLPCTVELHHRLTSLPLVHEPLFPEFQSRAITLGPDSSRLQTLSPEDTLLHLCLHLLAHMERYGWRLRHCCDIARHLQTFVVDWNIFESQVQSVGMSRACEAVLGLTALVTDASIPVIYIDHTMPPILLDYPLPGSKEHHFLAGLLQELFHGNIWRAWTMLLPAMGQQKAALQRSSPRRPLPLLTSIYSLVREAISQDSHLRNQLRLWRADSVCQEERRKTIQHLLAPVEIEPFTATPLNFASLTHASILYKLLMRTLRSLLLFISLAAIAVAITFKLFYRAFFIRGTSMEPNLKAGCRLIVNTSTYRRQAVRRADIVVVKDPRDERRLDVKRVIGLPGEVVAIDRGCIMINGTLLEERYATVPGVYRWGPSRVPQNSYFVLGDNRQTSVDSHCWGSVLKCRIVGKATVIYWPSFRNL